MPVWKPIVIDVAKVNIPLYDNRRVMFWTNILVTREMIQAALHVIFVSIELRIVLSVRQDSEANIWTQEGWEWEVEKASQWGAYIFYRSRSQCD